MQIFVEYPYLLGSLSLLLIALLLFTLLPRHRAVLAHAFVFSIPSGLLSYLFVPAYWNPRFTFHYLSSPEDLLFSASTGTIACAFAFVPFGARWTMRLDVRKAFRRISVTLITMLLTIEILLHSIFDATDVMWVVLPTMVLVGSYVLARHRELWKISVVSATGFLLFYGVWLVSLKLTIWPHLLEAWNPAAQLPFLILGLPAFELVWAFTFGAVWPIFFVWCCEPVSEPVKSI
jgi:hypothetical protein